MGRLSSGISQIGGKFRLLKKVLKRIPYHEFYLEPFLGSAIVLINKPRCRYECGNDVDSQLINYLLMVRAYPDEFDEFKKGVLGLASHEICRRIVNGKLKPKSDLERAYFFFYLNKLTFGSTYWKTQEKPPMKGIDPLNQVGKWSGSRGIMKPGGISDEDKKKMKNKADFCKGNYRGISPKKSIRARVKGISPKTTRPYTNNDCGILTPVDRGAVRRLRYVNLTAYPFQKLYKMFYRGFFTKKGLMTECFIYFDPPYPGTESYYASGFTKQDHADLIKILKTSPFNWLLSIGKECDFYLKELRDFKIEPVDVKYATAANHQTDSREYFISNYEIDDIGRMTKDGLKVKSFTELFDFK